MKDVLKSIAEGTASGVMLVVSADDLRSLMKDFYDLAARDHAARMEAAAERPALSREEAAKALGVCPTTLWHWQKSGYLTPVKVGARVLYRASDIKSILERAEEGRPR